MTARRASLAAIACASMASVAACSKADDAPGPEPVCQILWATLGSGANRYDVYLVEMKTDQWIGPGPRTFSFDDGVFGVVYDEFDQESGDYFRRAAADGGTFVLGSSASAEPAVGGAIGWSDPDAQPYYGVGGDEVLTAQVLASGGIGSFAGEWSPAGDPTPGAGTVSITFVTGTTGEVTFGTYVRYAECFDGESGSAASNANASSRWPLPRFPRP